MFFRNVSSHLNWSIIRLVKCLGNVKTIPFIFMTVTKYDHVYDVSIFCLHISRWLILKLRRIFTRPCILYGESIRFSVYVCLSVCLCFKWFLSNNRSQLLVDRSSSNLVERWKILTCQSSEKFMMIAFTIKTQARNNEQTYRQGK